ncbi:MAG TPA: FMN-binding negative transcriptional regulator [Rhodoblastus sp.]|nr:FMN-binding negative transcriptional regulator [Rhodoblastus sp.]
MHEPVVFRVEDKAELVAFIRAFPLGLLVAPRGRDGFFVSADLVPFVIDDHGTILRAHVAAANPLCATLAAPHEVLVVFQGPQAYVSPAHYPSKHAHGRVVPTWNYAMVQVEGLAQRRHGGEWKAEQVAALTEQMEKERPAPWKVGDAPEAFVAAQLRAITGLEIEIAALKGKYKLSQNRDDADRKGVIAGLAAEASPASRALARFMAAAKEPVIRG